MQAGYPSWLSKLSRWFLKSKIMQAGYPSWLSKLSRWFLKSKVIQAKLPVLQVAGFASRWRIQALILLVASFSNPPNSRNRHRLRSPAPILIQT